MFEIFALRVSIFNLMYKTRSQDQEAYQLVTKFLSLMKCLLPFEFVINHDISRHFQKQFNLQTSQSRESAQFFINFKSAV